MRVEVVIAVVMLFSFFMLDWFEAGPLLSIKGYNIVSTLDRLTQAFGSGQSSIEGSGLWIYYGFFAMPITALIGMYLSYKDLRKQAFSVMGGGAIVVIIIMVLQTVTSSFAIIEVFGPGAWLALGSCIAIHIAASDYSKKEKSMSVGSRPSPHS